MLDDLEIKLLLKECFSVADGKIAEIEMIVEDARLLRI